MPIETNSVDEWRRHAESALEIRVKKVGDVVKLKARTRRNLVTIKLSENDANQLIQEYKGKGKSIREF
ncbi:MAG: 50S ribosomal protein L38e [Thermocladium sp.]